MKLSFRAQNNSNRGFFWSFASMLDLTHNGGCRRPYFVTFAHSAELWGGTISSA